MKPDTVDALHEMTLKACALLITEISAQLEGRYGFLPSGQCRPAAEYPVLTGHPTAAATRHRLETLLDDELHAGLTAKQTREKLVKEAAFTWPTNWLPSKGCVEKHLRKRYGKILCRTT